MSNKKPYILIADDDSDDRLMLAGAFTAVFPEINIESLADGDEVLAYLAARDADFPALIILDYKMPRMSGADVLRALARNQRYGRIPKILWTTSSRDTEKAQCLGLGASKFFVKPDNEEELFRTVVELEELLSPVTGSH